MIEISMTIGLLFLALILGIKHSFDADHLVAVSGLLTRSETVKRTMSLSLSWSLGHMATASILTIILFTFRETLLKGVLNSLEILVPLMLILIAFLTLAWEFDLIHYHRHEHQGEHTDQSAEHSHFHPHISKNRKNEHGAMVGIGIVHGIASNDELLLLFTLTLGINSLFGILAGVLFFTVGVIAGMVVYGLSINFPIQKWGQKRVSRVINVSIASLSIFYAVWLLVGLEGINIFEALGSVF
ncbi:MAG: HoxN/HupN/NixA family nickel/cobalt transporter [Candidatus Hodarchaeales archaeon]|jgi:high-affinity nickel permease